MRARIALPALGFVHLATLTVSAAAYGETFFTMDYSAGGAPVAGWDAGVGHEGGVEPEIAQFMTQAPVWRLTRVAGGGPGGRDAYEMSILYYPYASEFYGGQFRWGWWGYLETTDPPRGVSRFYRWRMRFEPETNFRGRDWGDGTLSGMTNKIFLLGDGGTTRRCRVIVESQTNPGATTVRSIAIQLDAGTDGIPTGPWPLNQWLNIQIEVKSSTTSSTADGYFKMWINNNNYSSPNANRTNITLDPSNWKFVRFGGAQSHGVQSDGRYKFRNADFQAATSFDPAWSSEEDGTTPRPPTDVIVQ